jgi:hypothetical protein
MGEIWFMLLLQVLLELTSSQEKRKVGLCVTRMGAGSNGRLRMIFTKVKSLALATETTSANLVQISLKSFW